MDRFTHIKQFLRNYPSDPILAADYFVSQPLGQGPGNFVTQGSD
jgi:hypothetical protein